MKGAVAAGTILVVPNARGVLVPDISGSMGCDCGPLRRCPSAEKAVPFPSDCTSILLHWQINRGHRHEYRSGSQASVG